MGIKGDKMSKDSEISADLLLEKLSSIDGISSKKMFGGHGIFHEGKMFGLIDSKGKAFLKAKASDAESFLKQGAEQHSRMPYFSIPAVILEDHKSLTGWAHQAIASSK